jgi:hypothetical protein
MSTPDPDNLPRHTRVEMAAYVIAQFQAMGLEPPPRVMEMHRVLSRGYVPPEDPDIWTALESLRDLHQLGFIFDQLHSHRCNPRFRQYVKHLRNDPVLPQEDRLNAQGRNYQFQLYLAAICQRGGLLPVCYEEPDVLSTVEGRTFAIAAKRVTSDRPARFEERVRQAADQIQRRNLSGIVAVDLSISRNRDNQPIISPLQSQLFEAYANEQNRRLFEEREQEIYRWVEGKGVRAVLVFDFRIRLRPDRQWGLDGTMCWLPTVHDNEQANREYTSFREGFCRGVPGLVESMTES